MDIISIFDKNINFTTGSIPGLLCIDHIFNITVHDIIEKIITGDIFFDLKLRMARKILDSNDIVIYICTKNDNQCGLYFHPILIKTILMYIESSLSKSQIMQEMYSHQNTVYVSIDSFRQLSLLHMVTNIKIPQNIRNKPYICPGILNNDDMFNDDILTTECEKYLLEQSLESLIIKCLIDIICSYI
jgi:hypothetical protein